MVVCVHINTICLIYKHFARVARYRHAKEKILRVCLHAMHTFISPGQRETRTYECTFVPSKFCLLWEQKVTRDVI